MNHYFQCFATISTIMLQFHNDDDDDDDDDNNDNNNKS